MGKQQKTTEAPTHDNLINYYSEKYYKGGHKEKIKEKLLSNGDLFNQALQDIHKEKYSTISFDDFKNKYISTYGDPFPEKKKSLSQNGSENQKTPSLDGALESQEAVSNGSQKTLSESPEYVDFSKEPKVDNGFFTPDNTAVINTDININDEARLEQERLQSEKDSAEREKYLQSVDNGIGVFKSAGNDIAQSAIHGVGENLKAIGIEAKDLDWFDEYDGMKAEELATYRAGDWLQETAKELFPTNPKFQDDFLAHTLPSATGSMLNFVGGGLATKGITNLAMKGASKLAKRQVANRLGGLTVATLGATQQAATEYQNALAANGGDHEKAMDVFYMSLPIGAIEGVPFTKFLKRLDNSSGGYVQKYLTNTSLDKITKTLNKVESSVAGQAGLGGLEEMTQEISSNALTNVVASETYDKTREIFEGAGEQGAAGFLIGAMLNGMGTSLRKKHSEAATPEEKADIQKAIDYVEVKEKELNYKNSLSDLNTNISEILKKDNITNSDLQEVGKLENEIDQINETVKAEVDRRTAGITDRLGELRLERDLVYQGKTSGIEIQEAAQREKEINKEMLTLLIERQKVKQQVLNEKTNTTGDPGAEQETVAPEQQMPVSEGDSTPADQGIIDFTSQEDTSGIKATEKTANTEMPALPAQEVVDDASPGEDVAFSSTKEKIYEVGNQKYSVKKSDSGIEIINNGTGTVIDRKSKSYDQVLANYKQDAIPTFKEGKKADVTESADLGEYLQSVIDTSENPEEIASAYISAPEGQLDIKDQAIKDNLRKLPFSGLQRFGDTNKLKGASQIKFNYINNKGVPLDVQAQEISEIAGIEITPQDIVDFIERYPNGTNSVIADNSIKKGLSDKFLKLTGIELDEDYARKIGEENKVYENIVRDLPDDVLDLIASEGITSENIDQFKEQYFSGFPFSEEDFDLVKTHYANEQQGRKSQEGSQGAYRTGTKSEGREGEEGRGDDSKREGKDSSVIEKYRDKSKGQKETLKEISDLRLSHVGGLNMGSNQAKGTYISTEAENRYSSRGGKLFDAEVSIENPLRLESINDFFEIQREIIKQNFPDAEGSIDNLSDTEFQQLGELVTAQLQKAGYDSIYFPESEDQEGELIVFDRSNVKLIPPATTKEADKESEEPKERRRFAVQIEKGNDIEAEVKENLTEKTKFYTPISNVKTIEEANQYIKDANLDEALSTLKDKNSAMPPRVRVALGEGIIKKANEGFREATTQAEKDKFLAKAVEAAEFTSEYLTELGQGVQAASIFGRLSWEGLVMHIQKKIKKARNERIEKIAPELDKKRETLNTINDEIVDQLLDDPKYKKIIEDKLKKVSNKIRKKGVDKAIDLLEKLKNSIDTSSGQAYDALYLLTAKALKGIITAVQKALKAGDSAVTAINKAIAEHKKDNKEPFDEENLRKDLYDQLKPLESTFDPETAVKRGLKEMGTNIRELIKQHYTKADSTKRTLIDKLVKDAEMDEADAKELAGQINEAFTKLATKAKEKALKAETSIREKIQPKLSKSIDDKLIELSNLGALSEEDFNKIYAEKLGIKELSKEEITRLKELSDKIQEADVFADEAKENFTKENIEKHISLQKEKQKALNEVSDIMSAKAPKDVWDTLSVILQGNLLSPISIVTNVYSNFNLMPLRYLSRLSAQGLDALYSKATGKPRKIDLMAASKGYNVGYLQGTKQGWQEFKEGSNVAEINKADIQRGLKPLKAFIEGFDPKKAQTINERISNIMEGTFGFPAEGMFRALTLGDRPFQIGAEYAKAFELAKLKGLEGEALDKFIMFPDAESAELIKKAGEDATFKQSGGIGDFVSRGIISGLKWLSKLPVVGGPAKFFVKTQVPYVKTPINIILETFDYALPQITFLKALYYSNNYNGQKNRVKAFEYLGKTVVGVIIQSVAVEMFKNGLLSGDPEKEKKERSLQHSAFPPNGFNISAFLRGGDYAPQKNDTWIGYDKMGVTGVIFSMVANGENHKVREGKVFTSGMDEVLYDTFASMPNAASTALEMSFLQGANTFLDAVKSGEWDSWISNTMNAVTAVPIPNTVSAFNRASRTNLPELRDADLYTRLGNVMKAKVFMAGSLPSKVDLWGNKIKQTPATTSPFLPNTVAPWFYHLFDVTKNREISADQVSFEIYKLWRDTDNAEAIPAVPTQQITWEEEKFKLNAKLYEQYQIEIGKAREVLVRSFIDTEEYKTLSDFEKIDYLKDLYEEGFEAGKEAFMEKFGAEVLKTAKTK